MKKLVETVLAVALFALGAMLLSLPSHAQELKKLRVSIIPIIDVAPLMAARKYNYFADEGLQIDTSPVAGGAVGIPALIGGAIDITFSNAVSSMLAAAQGLDIQVVAPATSLVDAPTVSVLVGRKGDTYNFAKDFEGKTIGVNTRNGINWLYARAWVKKRGGDPDKITFKEVPFPQILDALKRRQVDMALTGEPFKSVTLKDPEFAIVGSPFVEVQPGLDVGQYLTTGAYAKMNPDTVVRFVRALRKGVAWYNAHLTSNDLAEMVADYTKLPVATIAEMKLTPLPNVSSVEQMQKTAAVMREHGLLTTDVDVKKFVLPIATAQ